MGVDRGRLPRPGARRMIPGLRVLGRDRSLVVFFVLATALSWAYWVPVALAGGTASHFPGLVGPLLAALIVTVRTGRSGELWRQVLHPAVARWWLMALAPLAILAVVASAQHLTGGGPSWRDLSRMSGLPALPWLAVFLAVLVVNGLGEEAGWRG